MLHVHQQAQTRTSARLAARIKTGVVNKLTEVTWDDLDTTDELSADENQEFAPARIIKKLVKKHAKTSKVVKKSSNKPVNVSTIEATQPDSIKKVVVVDYIQNLCKTVQKMEKNMIRRSYGVAYEMFCQGKAVDDLQNLYNKLNALFKSYSILNIC